MTTETNSTCETVSERSLWFGTAGAVMAWVLAGLLDVLFAWQACLGGERGSNVFTSTGMEILLGCISFGFLAVGVAAGVVSYKNWRKLSDQPDIISAEAKPRKQFMALVGVIVSLTLGVGMAWFSVPIYVLNICMRWR